MTLCIYLEVGPFLWGLSGCQEQKLLARSLLPSFTPEQAPGEPSEGKGELSVKSLESQLRKEGRKEL